MCALVNNKKNEFMQNVKLHFYFSLQSLSEVIRKVQI